MTRNYWYVHVAGSGGKGGKKKVSSSSFMTSSVVGRMSESQEEKYISVMKHLQYGQCPSCVAFVVAAAVFLAAAAAVVFLVFL